MLIVTTSLNVVVLDGLIKFIEPSPQPGSNTNKQQEKKPVSAHLNEGGNSRVRGKIEWAGRAG